jgi:hypothetical protein
VRSEERELEMNRFSRHPNRSARLAGQDGAVLIEFAMVFPFLMLLSMGVLEFGFIFRSNIMVSDTASSVSRSMANFGPERTADYNGLVTSIAGLSTLPAAAEVQRVVIFDADALESDIDSCKSMSLTPGQVGGIADICNVYTWDAILAADPNDFDGVACSDSDWDHRFCPLDRIDDPVAGLTAVGVWIDVEQKSVTHMFPWTSLQLDETRIMHIEPTVGDP